MRIVLGLTLAGAVILGGFWVLFSVLVFVGMPLLGMIFGLFS